MAFDNNNFPFSFNNRFNTSTAITFWSPVVKGPVNLGDGVIKDSMEVYGFNLKASKGSMDNSKGELRSSGRVISSIVEIIAQEDVYVEALIDALCKHGNIGNCTLTVLRNSGQDNMTDLSLQLQFFNSTLVAVDAGMTLDQYNLLASEPDSVWPLSFRLPLRRFSQTAEDLPTTTACRFALAYDAMAITHMPVNQTGAKAGTFAAFYDFKHNTSKDVDNRMGGGASGDLPTATV